MKFLNKPMGLTSNEFIFHLKRKKMIQNKACYCGRLDPMARGKMLILEGKECKQMFNYLNNNKTYEFIIVFGMSTDTDDIMGLFENNLSNNFSLLKQEELYKKILKNNIQALLSKPKQKYHKYSSYILRKYEKRLPLWKWEKMGLLKEDELPSKNIKVYKYEELEKCTINIKKLINIWIKLISKVNKRHKFRQDEIIQQYKNLIQQFDKQNQIKKENIKVLCVKYKIKVSSGFYVRQFICDLKRKIDFPLLVYDINRIEID